MSDQEHTPHIPSDDELADARDRVDELLTFDLSDDAFWVEPRAGVEASVMEAISAGPAGASISVLDAAAGKRRPWLVPAAVAAAIVALLAIATWRVDGPDWEVALAATENAPGVEAAVRGWNEASGTRLRLDVSGLDPAPAGHVYELWFTEGPVHVSAGTFTDPTDVTLWVGVRRADYPRLWITLEPLDADPSPGLNLLDTEA